MSVPPASLKSIVGSLFQNEKFGSTIITFSRVALTDSQKSQLFYPEGFVPLEFYIIYQTELRKPQPESPYQISLVSFCRKGDHIYGVYFDVVAQARLDRCVLKRSPHPVTLSEVARFITSQYLEVYNNVLGTTVILGLSTDPNQIGASLQFSHGHRYYYQFTTATGIADPNIPKTRLTGLSRNLKC